MAGKRKSHSAAFKTQVALVALQYEDVYLKLYETVPALACGVQAYIGCYNGEQLQRALDYRTPAAVYAAR
jgi:hypothetical protein